MPRRRDILSAVSALAARVGAVAPAPPPLAMVAAPLAASAKRVPLPLGDASVVGTRYHAAPRVAARLRAGQALLVRREPANTRDPWAVAIHTPEGERLGYLPRSENRRIAQILDAGGRIEAEMLDGHPFEATPGNWRIAARLSLVDAGPVAASPADALDQVANLLQAQPLMAERFGGPDTGGRAVMLTGPCAGWQRTKEVEWVPPGALPLPSWQVVAQDYRLVGGEAARIQTARALAEATRLGIAMPGVDPALAPPAPAALAKPAERPRPLLRGWLPAPGRSLEAAKDALRYLKLRQSRDDPRGPNTVLVLDRHDRAVGPLPRQAGEIISRLIGEGYEVAIFARDPGPQATAEGHVSVPYEICLRGDDPPHIARNRAELLLHIARVVPEAWDVERRFGTSPPGLLWRFLERASPIAHRNGGRLTVAQADEILARVTPAPEEDHDPASTQVPEPRRPARTREGIGDALSPKRRGRGMPLPQRLRMVAIRLEAGLRETPQRFVPVAAYVSGLGTRAKQRFMQSLIIETLVEAVLDPNCPEAVRRLLIEARDLTRADCTDRMGRRRALLEAVRLAAPPLRRRRSIHCHGAVTTDRRLLFLRAILTDREDKAFGLATLRWAIAYAMADYDHDHFVMQGAHLGRRVRRLADWVEAEMATTAGLAVEPIRWETAP